MLAAENEAMHDIKRPAALSDDALDILFRTARSYNAFEPGTISDATCTRSTS